LEKRVLLATALAFAVIFIWYSMFPAQPRPAAAPAGGAPAETAAQSAAAPAGSVVPAAPAATRTAAPAPTGAPAAPAQAAAGEERVTLETDLAVIVLTNRGARAQSWTLKNFTVNGGTPLDLVSPAAGKGTPDLRPLDLVTGQKDLDEALTSALFVAERSSDGTGESVSFRWSDGAGTAAEKTLACTRDDYACTVTASVMRSGRPVPVYLVWGPGIGPTVKPGGGGGLDHVGFGVVGLADSSEIHDPARLTEAQSFAAGTTTWAAVDERYFTAFMRPAAAADTMPETRLVPVSVLPEPGGEVVPHLALAVAADKPLLLWAGPKEWDRLKAMPGGLYRLVNLGRPVFLPLIGPLLEPVIELLARGFYFALRWLHEHGINWGIAIILVTFGIRLVFFPIMQRTMVKMRQTQQRMQAVQPKANAIKARYAKIKGADARTKMNQEIMELYQKEGINPFSSLSGCLPLLLQLPILAAFYNVLTASIELRHAPFFGWITDLSAKDPYYITPLLMGATMFLQQKMAMTKTTDPQMRTQQRMMLIMPVMFTVFFMNLPSGLTLYWFVSNLLQIGQQVLINRQADRVLAAGQTRTA